MAAQDVHLPEPVLRGDEALRDQQVVEAGGTDVGHSLGIALDRDRRGESGDGEVAVQLRQRVAHGLVGPEARGEEGGQREDQRCCCEENEGTEEEAATNGLERREFLGSNLRVVGREVAGGQSRFGGD